MINPLLIKAIKKANQIRTRLGLDMFEPVNIFDACLDLDVTLRFVDINMEGMYISQNNGKNSTILLSNQRPLPRRCYTCAHELGHHVFGHGNSLDALHTDDSSSNNQDEFLVDAFAGALLMPIAGVQAEFSSRNWNPQDASPIQFYVIASVFGTGYSTLITHCKLNRLLSENEAKLLLKSTPAKILESLLGKNIINSYFKIIDSYFSKSIIDIEVSNYIFLPQTTKVEGSQLKEYKKTDIGSSYIAIKPGIVRATSEGKSYFIRIQNSGYVGLSENRHLENIID